MFVIVDWEDRRPAYLQLRDQIVEAMARGELDRGTALPSVRRLASELELNLHTVHKAFELLRDQGFIQLRPGASAIARPMAADDAPEHLGQALGPVLAEAWVKGMTREDVLAAVAAILDTFQIPNEAAPPDGHRARKEGV